MGKELIANQVKMLDPVHVKTPDDGGYGIHVMEAWPDDLSRRLKAVVGSDRFFLITEERLKNQVVTPFLEKLPLPDSRIIYIQGGESNKHLSRLDGIFNSLILNGVDRSSVILALGGGVVGDLAGFVAATVLRGIPFVQFPTTLLAAVDSSVGGKVAVNVDYGKNMVGSFHYPAAVYFDTSRLQTLPDREWSCGLAEMAKHAFMDTALFELTARYAKELRNATSPILREVVVENIRFKSSVVSEDPTEKGRRAILNLGHTTAHAIESITRYAKFNHGEAVARGLVTMLLLSQELLGLSRSGIDQMFALLKNLSLPMDTCGLEGPELFQHTRFDKKNQADRTRYVLLKESGVPVTGVEIDEKSFCRAWDMQRKLFG